MPYLLAVLLLLCAGCANGDLTSAEATEAADSEAFIEKAIGCANGCCGSAYNCAVPEPRRRRGCSGARLRNPVTGGCTFPIKLGGDCTLSGGMGRPIGTVRSSAVHLNQGIRKRRDGAWRVYVFNTRVRLPDGTSRAASGWMRQAALEHADRLYDHTLALSDPGQGTYKTRWRITTANRERYARLRLRDLRGQRYPAQDYLVRPYGLAHLTYSVPGFNLGGHATDSFSPGAIFRRSKGVKQIVVPLYGPQGYRSSYSLHFVYGYVHDGEGRRYGWVAKEALEVAPADPVGPSGGNTCSARCCDDSVQTGLASGDGQTCVRASSRACDARGHVERARFNGEVVYSRDRRCWALCGNRERYHEVEGVVSGCTDRARAFCGVNDRGGLVDAAWSACRPN